MYPLHIWFQRQITLSTCLFLGVHSNRYVSLRQKSGNNNKIERFHETFRQRDKVMRGFKGNQKQYAENFQTYYNFVRKHSKIGMTPAQKAKIDQKADWKELLTKAMQSPVPESQTRLV